MWAEKGKRIHDLTIGNQQNQSTESDFLLSVSVYSSGRSCAPFIFKKKKKKAFNFLHSPILNTFGVHRPSAVNKLLLKGGRIWSEDSPASGNPRELHCDKSTQKPEEEMLMGVFLPASSVLWSERAVCRGSAAMFYTVAACGVLFPTEVAVLTSHLIPVNK